MVEVVDVQFRPGQKVYYFDPAGKIITTGSHLIIETSRGPEYGICTAGNHFIPEKEVVPPLRSVIRFATEADERQVTEIRSKEKKAFSVCLQKIEEHGLDMQLVAAEYSFDGSKILFIFTADERVDFRELVKNLAGIFHTRIELRQIGVRDKAKMVGGLGICGRPFCCAQFLSDFQPVSIKMAKTQNLSLNPTKISGTCGRLMCCLKYEQEAYEDLISTSPKMESFVDTPDGRGTVVDVNLLRQNVKVRMENAPETVGCYQNCDICVLRSGKAKKNDPPIPADLAPISGSGKRPEKKREEAEPAMLDAVKFRYSEENVVEEKPIPEEPAAPAADSQENRAKRRRRPKSGKPSEDRPAEQKQEKPEKAEKPEKTEKTDKPRPPRKPRPEKKPTEEKPQDAPQPAQEKPDGETHRRRRNNYRRRRPKAPGEGGQE
ncbi:MAG: hypothetical protein IJ960_03820 [Oscillospiraceae bacterium]|nr:hypothetical protein [Oscillospiraceae bacterium]